MHTVLDEKKINGKSVDHLGTRALFRIIKVIRISFQIQCDSKNGRGIFFFEFSAPILRLKGRPYKKN